MNFKILVGVSIPVLLLIVIFGCDWDSSESYSNSQGHEIDISGPYMVIITPYSEMESMILRQTANKLEGTDNLGRVWTGTLSGIAVTQSAAGTTPQSWKGQVYMETGGSSRYPRSGKINGQFFTFTEPMGGIDTDNPPAFGVIHTGSGSTSITIEGMYTKNDGKIGPFSMWTYSEPDRSQGVGTGT